VAKQLSLLIGLAYCRHEVTQVSRFVTLQQSHCQRKWFHDLRITPMAHLWFYRVILSRNFIVT